ncbi:DUF6371 domain-containing protein [Hymenobacter persicinus]|uniref:Uncharacterized protein n=1 Tax=Hymenobacter persicinus TaxID=2025506 RepID=A0A4Q5LA92_9BACT|nr:DUF6371 domain-containing protein [Hymenobacter persicinus]RYU78800.1 hypothetical protein EWM57_12790 [Hymenobacter persicinus]
MAFRYQLQPYRGSRKNRYTCPGCNKPYSFTRWQDLRTAELLPQQFGRCNRMNSCGYSLSPYDKVSNSISYADDQWRSNLEGRTMSSCQPKPQPAQQLCTIPETVLQQSLSCYERNAFAQLLQKHFGAGVAIDLLNRFEIGTSTYWPGATVFWQRDELDRIRGGQVVLFDESGHTSKLPAQDGTPKRCTTWVHTAYAQACRQQKKQLPAWLVRYLEPGVSKSPSLYGIRQLNKVAVGQPIAIVEAPKTAVICSGYFPQFIWLAVGSLSYLTVQRLTPVKGYSITLYPDASIDGSAFQVWCTKADVLRKAGFIVQVSDILEKAATACQKATGSDLADLLLEQWIGYPQSWV